MAVVASLCAASPAIAAHTWPLSNSATPDVMNTSFGPRFNFSQWDFHDGIDLPAPIGTPCYAVADGTIFREGPAGTDFYSSRHVILRSVEASGATLYWQYLHLSAIAPGIAEGATIAQGSYLGDAGDDDAAYSHLHFEVRRHGGNQDNSVHLLEELPYTNTANFTAPVADRFNRSGALMAARMLFDAPSKEEGDLIRVEVDLMNGVTVVATRFVDFDDKATISEGDNDASEFTNDIAVEGYQSSDMPADGFAELEYGVLVRNLPAGVDGLVVRVKDLGGNLAMSATVPVPAQAAVDASATFETGSVDAGWSAVTSVTGSGTTLLVDAASAREGVLGLACADSSTSEFTLQSAAIARALPAGRFAWTAEGWFNPASFSLSPNGQAIYLLEFTSGTNLCCAAYMRNASGTVVAGIAALRPGGVLGGVDSSWTVPANSWHHWRLALKRIGTRTTNAALSIDGVVQRRYQWSTTAYDPDGVVAGIGLISPGATALVRCDGVRVTELDDPPYPSFALPPSPGGGSAPPTPGSTTTATAAPAESVPDPGPNAFMAAPNFLGGAGAGAITFFVRGNPGGSAELRLYDEAGLFIRSLAIPLDGTGRGRAVFDGTGRGGKPLAAGAYWALASGGGVKGKKPFMVGGPP